MENFIQYTPILLAIIGLIVMYIQSVWVRKQPAGTDKMQSISKSIKEGALAFLNAEYRLLSVFVLVVSAVLAGISFILPTTHILILVSFIFAPINCSSKPFKKRSLPNSSCTPLPSLPSNLLPSTVAE